MTDEQTESIPIEQLISSIKLSASSKQRELKSTLGGEPTLLADIEAVLAEIQNVYDESEQRKKLEKLAKLLENQIPTLYLVSQKIERGESVQELLKVIPYRALVRTLHPDEFRLFSFFYKMANHVMTAINAAHDEQKEASRRFQPSAKTQPTKKKPVDIKIDFGAINRGRERFLFEARIRQLNDYANPDLIAQHLILVLEEMPVDCRVGKFSNHEEYIESIAQIVHYSLDQLRKFGMDFSIDQDEEPDYGVSDILIHLIAVREFHAQLEQARSISKFIGILSAFKQDRIYFINSLNYRFTIEDVITALKKRNVKATDRPLKQEVESFLEDTTPEEIRTQGSFLDDILDRFF